MNEGISLSRVGSYSVVQADFPISVSVLRFQVFNHSTCSHCLKLNWHYPGHVYSIYLLMIPGQQLPSLTAVDLSIWCCAFSYFGYIPKSGIAK